MSNPTLIITSISEENNYIRIDANIEEPKDAIIEEPKSETSSEIPTMKSIEDESASVPESVLNPSNAYDLISKNRLMTSYYPKKSTSFNIEQEALVTPKGTIYANYFVISNHMGMGTIRISETLVGNITQGPFGQAFTSQTFTAFMTEYTGA